MFLKDDDRGEESKGNSSKHSSSRNVSMPSSNDISSSLLERFSAPKSTNNAITSKDNMVLSDIEEKYY